MATVTQVVTGPTSGALTGIAAATYTAQVAANNAIGRGPLSGASSAFTVTGQQQSTVRTWKAGMFDTSPANVPAWTSTFYAPQVIHQFCNYMASQTGAAAFTQQTANITNRQSGGAWLASTDDGSTTNVASIALVPSAATSIQAGLLSSAAGGSDVSSWTALGNALVTAGMNHTSTVLRVGWEMNGNWYAWATGGDATNAANYKSAWIKMHDAVHAVANKVRFCMCWNASNGGNASFALHYPGDAYVDIIGIDQYDYGSSAVTTDASYTALGNGLGIPAAAVFANAHGKKISLNEWGVDGAPGNHGDNANFIQATYDALLAANNAYPGIVAFDTYENDPSSSHVITGSAHPNSKAKYLALWTATTPGGVVQPPASTSVTTSGTTATVSWAAPTTGAPSSYVVARDGTDSNGSGAYSTTVSGTTTPLSFTFASLVPGSTYNLSVAAVVNGASSAAVSKPITIATVVPPTSTTHKYSAWTGSEAYSDTFLRAMTGQTANKTGWWGRNYLSHGGSGDITGLSNASYGWSAWKSAGYGGMILGVPLGGDGYSCAQVAAGNADTYYLKLISDYNAAFPNGTGVFELGWEPNAAQGFAWNAPGPATVQQYKAAFDHVASLVHAHSALLVDYTLSGQSNAMPSAGVPDPSSVDIYGVDAYDTVYTTPATTNVNTRWQKVVNGAGGQVAMAQVIALAKANGKGWSCNEWGVSPTSNGNGGGDNAHYISNMMHLFKTGNDLDGVITTNYPSFCDSYYSQAYDILSGSYPNAKAAYIAAYSG